MGYRNPEDRRAAWRRWWDKQTQEYRSSYRLREQERQRKDYAIRSQTTAYTHRRSMYNKLIARFAKFDLTHRDFGYMMERCGGECAGCGREMHTYATAKSDSAVASIDHDHSTNEIRGVLCARCNMILGYADDNPVTLRNLVAYLPQVR